MKNPKKYYTYIIHPSVQLIFTFALFISSMELLDLLAYGLRIMGKYKQ